MHNHSLRIWMSEVRCELAGLCLLKAKLYCNEQSSANLHISSVDECVFLLLWQSFHVYQVTSDLWNSLSTLFVLDYGDL